MALSTRGPAKYRRLGSLFDGLPLSVADGAFSSYANAIAVGGGSLWTGPTVHATAPLANTVTDVSGGWALSSTSSSTTGGSAKLNNSGRLVLTSGTTDEDLTQAQLLSMPFRYTTTRKLKFFVRVATSTHNTSDAFVGLSIADTTVIATSAEGVSDCMAFVKAATATDWTANVQKDGTATTGASGLTLASADQFTVLGLSIEAGVIRRYAVLDPNDRVKNEPGLLGAGTVIANTNAPDDEDMYLTFAVGQEGGTTARTLTVDWAFACGWH